MRSGPAEVEAAVEGGRLVVPGPLDGGDGDGGDVEFGVALFVDDVLGGGEAHLLQGVAGGFEGVDLGGGELVGGGLVPVGGAIFEGVEGEAHGLDFLLPVFAGGEGDALHYSPAPPACPLKWLPPSEKELPKPPRRVLPELLM